MPGGQVKVVAQSTIRARIDCVYGTKEQEHPSEGTEKGQGQESCTKMELLGARRGEKSPGYDAWT